MSGGLRLRSDTALLLPPSRAGFDVGCDDAQPINDDPRLNDNNVQYMVRGGGGGGVVCRSMT
jgi:hypothetical protein